MSSMVPYETASADTLLTSLGLAIAEARMTRTLLRNRKRGQCSAVAQDKLTSLDREIDYLETTLFELRSESFRDPVTR